METIQLVVIVLCLVAIVAPVAWLTHEYREAEKRMHDRQGYQPERRKS